MTMMNITMEESLIDDDGEHHDDEDGNTCLQDTW